MKLSDFFQHNLLRSDGEFITLGYVDSNILGTLAFCDSIFYLNKANQNTNISCVILKEDIGDQAGYEKGVVVADNPRNTFYTLHHSLLSNRDYGLQLEGRIGENCSIHPSATVSKDTIIGDRVTIAENVVIKDGVIIGDNTFIDTGAVVGCDGLLYMRDEEDNVTFIRHAGGVTIGHNVTILSNAKIVRSVHDSHLTSIGNNSIVGISSNIGHEAKIGDNCVLSSNCVVARRATLGDGVWVGPSSVIREHVMIADGAQVKLGSVVVKDVAKGQVVSGNFALEHNRNLMSYVKRI